MMAQPTSIVIVAALLINILSYCSAENVYCVTPTATSCSSCPPYTNCTTLSEYAQEAELYFTSNTTMVFLPGDHVLDRNITVDNVTSLTMHGKSSDNIATVVRNGSVGFSFTNMVDFNIYSLAFTSCNRSLSYGSRSASNSALFLRSAQNTKLVNCSFHDNFGTALAVINTNITLEENSKFIHNQCACQSFSEVHDYGCGIAALNSNLTFTGNTCFHENTQTTSSSSYFMYCGGAIWASASSLYFNGMNNFTGNSANGNNGVGGAIYANTNSLLSFIGTSTFRHNSAERYGGVIYAKVNTLLSFSGTSTFRHNSAGRYGGAIAAYENVVFMFHGANNFINNTAELYSGAIDAYVNVELTFYGTNNFINNSANSGGAIYAGVDALLSFNGTNSLMNNCAVQGGAIFAYDSTLTFNEKLSFTDNGHNTEDSRGGAIYLKSATFSILPQTTVHWESNHAHLGGAIYVFDTDPRIYCTQNDTYNIQKPKCFFQLPGQDLSNGADVRLVFKNNFADAAGSLLYGGAIDNCMLVGLDSNSSGEVFDMLVHNEDDTDYSTTSNISSDPFHICPCENNHPDCSKSNTILTAYPDESYQVSVVVVGQREGIVPANVVTNMDRCKLSCSEFVQQTYKICTTLNYTVDTAMNVSLKLHTQICSGDDNLVLELNGTQSCPLGLSLENRSCVCDQVLQKYTNQCSIINGLGQITRLSNDTFWVGINDQSDVLILHPHCPFDYCVNDTVVFTLNDTDLQCANNRSGYLCGSCKEGYSLALGNFQCVENSMRCTNNYLSLLIVFAVMGVALVFLLFVCKLTVATGTLSGLLFYANIVGVNRTIFLPVESAYPLSVFIAWLNLDFGIETCFYDGMTAYIKTWLQFVFPVYIWLLVGLMILVSLFSPKFAKLLGKNPASVLATLILLSYPKILKTVITAVSFTDLEYHIISSTGLDYHIINFTNLDYITDQDRNLSVWLYDANIVYLTSIHIPLFLVSVFVFFFQFLPYTLLLFFIQWLQAISHLKLFSWVNSARLKPIIDSYHAPYKAKHRYWPGLLLVLRFVLYLVFALNYQRDPSINLLAILVGTGILQLWAWVSGGVYKNWCLDALEGSFVLNLIVLSVATYHVQHSGGNQLAVWYTSVSIAFATFIGILAYHIFQQLRHTKLWKKVPKLNMKLRFKKLKTKLNKKLSTKQAEDISLNDLTNDLTESVKFDQLREPLLDDLPQPTYSVV